MTDAADILNALDIPAAVVDAAGAVTANAAFDAAGGAANPLSATAGIGEALITTAGGLVASLLLLFPYNILADKVEE